MTHTDLEGIVKFVSGALLLDFMDSTKDAWWVALKNLDAKKMSRAAEATVKHTDLNRLKLLSSLMGEYYALERAEQERIEHAERSRGVTDAKVLGRTAKTIVETNGDVKWRPETQAEREAAWLFGELLHQAQGARSVKAKAPTVGPDAMRALQSLGGFPGLKRLESHDVLYARQQFCTVMAGGG